MARMEDVGMKMVEAFQKYAGPDGSLSKDEFKKMVEQEVKNPDIRAKILSDDCASFMNMDRNGDGQVSFAEFAQCLAFLARCLHQRKTEGWCGTKS